MRMSFALFQLHQMAVTGLLLKVTPLFWHRVVPFTQIQMMSGAFQPYAKGECAPVADPYANYRAPEPGPCLNIGGISDIRSLVGSAGRNDDVLTVQSGADVDITAPPEGSKNGMPGMAFFQDIQTQLGNDGHFPNGENKLSSGGNLNITGTAYFPTQSVKVTSNAVFGSRAPATSFVAYELHFGGASTINVHPHSSATARPLQSR